MKQFIYQLLSWVVFGNSWVSVGAVVMSMLAYRLLFEEWELAPLWILFFGTLATYNLCVFYTQRAVSEKFEFILKKKKILQLVFIGSSLLLLPSAFFLSLNQFWYLVHLALISFFYTVPIHIELPSGNFLSMRAWRNVPYLKIFLIAYVWASATVIFPMLHEELIIKDPKTISLFAERFLFVLAITIPFDIRDYEDDQKIGLPTLVSALGIQKSKILASFLLILSTLLIYFFFVDYLFAFEAVYMLALILIWLSHSKRSEWFYTGLIDGLFVVEFVIVYFGVSKL